MYKRDLGKGRSIINFHRDAKMRYLKVHILRNMQSKVVELFPRTIGSFVNEKLLDNKIVVTLFQSGSETLLPYVSLSESIT